MGIPGKPRMGYALKDMIAAIENYLGWNKTDEAFLVGVGSLGHALLGHKPFEENGLKIIAGFDIDPRKVGTEIHGKKIFHLSKLSEMVKRMGVRVGIITVPWQEAQHVADVLEIGALTDRYPATLSGGEKQRVALGRALLAAPRLLLLDEPLAGLDQPLRDRLLPYLARVRDEFAIPMIYVTHSPDEVVALCYEVLVLEGGRVTRHGRVVDLFSPAQVPRYEYRPGPPTG